MPNKLLLANPRGFCAGVDRAIDVVERALEKYGSPIYVRHEVVHNKSVVEDLKDKGVIFVNELNEVPKHGKVIFSAHGVSQVVESDAQNRDLIYFDATCPLVTKVHNEVIRHARAGRDIILIGHEGHPEVEGTLGRHDSSKGSEIYLVQDNHDAKTITVKDENNIAYVTQTTLSLDDTSEIITTLSSRFPKLSKPKSSDICYATQNRQDAVKQLAMETDLVIVIGSVNSSNSNRLCELAQKCGVDSILIDDFSDIDINLISKYQSIGITAGASAPESIVEDVKINLESIFQIKSKELGINSEKIYFKLPPELR